MWTPDQVTNLVVQTGAVVGGLVTLVKLLHNNRLQSDQLANSVPADVHKQALENAAGTLLQAEPLMATVESKTPASGA
jgi:hypothetical protein